MGADIFLCPAFPLSLADCISLCLGSVFIQFGSPFVFIVGLQVFSKRNTGAFRVRNLTVLNHPALGPVRTNHTFLVCSGRGPGSGCLFYHETGQRNIVYPCFVRVEAVAAHVNLYVFFIWVSTLEISVYHSGISVLLSVPLVKGVFRFPGALVYLGIFNGLYGEYLIHGFAV